MQKQKNASNQSGGSIDEVETKERTPEQDALLDESTDWLDEIDKALEGLDHDLAASYVQVGGE